MSTAAQILANRENSKKSTGPTSKAGKIRASQNATTHGFYAKAFVVRDSERADFDQMREKLHADYMPIDDASEDIFQQILHAAWNLFRLRRMENEYYASSDDPYADETLLRKLDALRRHKGHFERALRSARKMFTEHLTAYWNLSAIPPDIRESMSPSVSAAHFNAVHINKFRIFGPEDFVSREKLEAFRAEDQERMKVAQRAFKKAPRAVQKLL